MSRSAPIKENNISRQLAEFIADTGYAGIPSKMLEAAKERILDTIGACIAGSIGWEYSKELIKGLRQAKEGNATVIGSKEKFPSYLAAMINSSYGHALELDDGHKNAGVHAGTVVVPTALAVGEAMHADGKALLTAVILGYETIYRIARSLNPAQIRKGFHPSATCGVFGSAAAAAKLMGLKEEQVINALGLAGMQTAGLMEATLSGQAAKCVMVGHASFAGITSALLAKEGLPGPVSVFEGKYGLFNTMSENVLPQDMLKELGQKFEIADTYVKLYPTCRHIHPAIESVISLQEEYKFPVQDIRRVVVGSHEVAVNLTGHIYSPQDGAEARFSLPYVIAVVLRERTMGIRHLGEAFLSDQGIGDIARLVEVRIDDQVNKAFPAKRGARVEIFLKNGSILERTTYILKGSPELPVDKEELRGKFVECAAGMLESGTSRHLIKMIDELEVLTDAEQIMQFLR